MGRKATGLRNRKRNGRHSYSKKDKRDGADRYGLFKDGVRLTADQIGGRKIVGRHRRVGRSTG